MTQMSRWRGGHQGKGGGRRAAKRAELRGGSNSSRLGSSYSVSRFTGVLCGQGSFSVEWGHVRACASYMVILVILVVNIWTAGVVTGF